MNDLEPQLGSTPAHTDPLGQDSVPAPPPRKEPGVLGRYWQWFLAGLALIVAVGTGAVVASNNDDSAVSATPTSTTAAEVVNTNAVQSTTTQPPPAAIGLDARAVGEKVIPSVVTVQIRGAAFDGAEVAVGSGSGVVYDRAGHIVTNNHVAEAGSSYEVVLSDGRVYPAEVVGTDPTTDLAVLEITAEDLQPISLGSSDSLVVGDPAVAVGSPLGLEGGPSLTVGVISAFGRTVGTSSSSGLFGMLQTDAPIISGSSGGALVDRDGALVGITTAVGVSAVGAEGIGFATPVEIVTRVADEIIASGSATSPYLGVEIETAMATTTDGGSSPIGVGLTNVVGGTAAEAAGLQTGDVISAINGVPVMTNSELVGDLRRYAAGDTIAVTLDDGRTIDVTLGQRPDNL